MLKFVYPAVQKYIYPAVQKYISHVMQKCIYNAKNIDSNFLIQKAMQVIGCVALQLGADPASKYNDVESRLDLIPLFPEAAVQFAQWYRLSPPLDVDPV